jgi:hypothetical protein
MEFSLKLLPGEEGGGGNSSGLNVIPGLGWLQSKFQGIQRDILQNDRENQIHSSLSTWDKDYAPQVGGLTSKKIVRMLAGCLSGFVVMGALKQIRGGGGGSNRGNQYGRRDI